MKIIYGMGKFEVPFSPFEQLILKQAAADRSMTVKEYIRSCAVLLAYEEARQNPDPETLSIWKQASPEERERLRRLLKESAALEALAEKKGVKPGEYIAMTVREEWRRLFPYDAVKGVIRTLRLCAAGQSKDEEEYAFHMRKLGLKTVAKSLVEIPHEIQPTLCCDIEGNIFTMGMNEEGRSCLLELQAIQ